MFTSGDLWAGVALPAGITFLVLLAAWRLTRRRMTARECRTWAGPLAVSTGFAAGYAAMFSWPALPPQDVIEWLPWLALPVAILGTWEAWQGPSLTARTATAAIVVPLAVGLIAWPLLARTTGHDEIGPLLLASVALLGFAWLLGGEELVGRLSAARFAMLHLTALIFASAALAISGSLLLAQIGLLLAATQMGALLAHGVLGRAGQARGVALVIGALYGGLLWYGTLYADLSRLCALLLLVAPQTAWLSIEMPRLFSSLRRAGVQVACVALVGGAALLLAWAASPAGEL